MLLNVEKKTRWILSVIVTITFLSYIFTGFGKTIWVIWLNVVFGIILGLFIYSETAIVSYIKSKKYKKIDSGDILVWFGAVFGTVVILNSIFFINVIRAIPPQGLVSFLSINGAIAGSIAGILALTLLWLPTPE